MRMSARTAKVKPTGRVVIGTQSACALVPSVPPRYARFAGQSAQGMPRAGMREAAQKAGIKLLEPIMKVEVVTPEDFLGTVLGDLNSRRGQVEGMEARGNAQVVRAFVPLSSMFGYTTDLRSATQGRATSSMEFAYYQALPEHLAKEIVEKRRG